MPKHKHTAVEHPSGTRGLWAVRKPDGSHVKDREGKVALWYMQSRAESKAQALTQNSRRRARKERKREARDAQSDLF